MLLMEPANGWMTDRPATRSPERDAAEPHGVMLRQGIGHLLVTDGDLIRAFNARRRGRPLARGLLARRRPGAEGPGVMGSASPAAPRSGMIPGASRGGEAAMRLASKFTLAFLITFGAGIAAIVTLQDHHVFGRTIARVAVFLLSVVTAFLLSRWFIGKTDERLKEALSRSEAEAAAHSEALEQLRRADRLATIGQLSSEIAHELGTPLNIVSARARRIETRDATPDEQVEYARIIGEQCARMTKIIRQLLDFARPRPPQRAPHDVRALVRQTLALIAPLAEKRRVSLVVDERAEAACAVLDPGRIQQALLNLIVNGLQAMPNGGRLTIGVRVGSPPPRVPPEAQAAADAQYVRVDVQDEGVGIPKEDLGRIFEPFFTTKRVGEGTGVGLPVTVGIVREHRGWIDVESEVGRGSRFSVFLPREEGTCAGAS